MQDENIGLPFAHVAQLAEVRDRACVIDDRLQQMAAPAQPADQAIPAALQHWAATVMTQEGTPPGRGRRMLV